jgi:hypothetical protein
MAYQPSGYMDYSMHYYLNIKLQGRIFARKKLIRISLKTYYLVVIVKVHHTGSGLRKWTQWTRHCLISEKVIVGIFRISWFISCWLSSLSECTKIPIIKCFSSMHTLSPYEQFCDKMRVINSLKSLLFNLEMLYRRYWRHWILLGWSENWK